MPRNGSGEYTLPPKNPVAPNTLIETTWANPTLTDIAVALTNSLDRNGTGGMLVAMKVVDGTLTAPGLAFISETSTGMWRPGAGQLGFSVLGVLLLSMTSTMMNVRPPVTFKDDVTFEAGATLDGDIVVGSLLNNQPPQSFAGFTPDWQMVGATQGASSFSQSRFSNGASGSITYLAHSRGVAEGEQALLSEHDTMGIVTFWGSDGVKFAEGARISASVDDPAGLDDMPGRLQFWTTPNNAVTPTLVMTLDHFGDVSMTGKLDVAGAMTVGSIGNLVVTGTTELQTTLVVGSTFPVPANTRAFIDRSGTSVIPALAAGTVLTLAGSPNDSAVAYLQMLGGRASNAGILFGDQDTAAQGHITYNHSADELRMGAAGVANVLLISGGAVTLNLPGLLANGTAALPALAFVNSPTTGLFRVGADILGFAISGAEKWRIDISGRLVAGGNAAIATRAAGTAVTPWLQQQALTSSGASSAQFVFDNGVATSTPFSFYARSRGTTLGTHGLVQAGDMLGRISFGGSDGTQFSEAARIQVVVDGTPGLNDMPGRIEFLTTPDGGFVPTATPVLTLKADNSAVFGGAVTFPSLGTGNATFSSDTLPIVIVDRPGASVNAVQSFRTTSGSVYMGQGSALTYTVSPNSNLSAPWFTLAAAGAALTIPLDSTTTGRFNGATQGLLGVRKTTGSTFTVNANADAIVIDSSGNGGLSILTSNASAGNIYFGDDVPNTGRIVYNHGTPAMTLVVETATALTLAVGAITVGAAHDLVISGIAPTSTLSAGFRGVPQNLQAGATYDCALTDAGKHIHHAAAGTIQVNILANGTTPFPIGTAITFTNQQGAGVMTITCADTMRLAGAGTTGSRALAANGIATAVKIASGQWIISGTGLT